MARLLKHPQAADTKFILPGDENLEIPVHKCVITARSDVLASMITPLEEDELKKKNELLDDKNTSSTDECNSSDVRVHASIN
jgi:hypothetical protein